MNRDEILRTAATYVTQDRQTDHGPPEANFLKIAHLWASYLGIGISSHDVALMMILLKVARANGTPSHLDNWVDIAGYAACGGELATQPSNVESRLE
jgi:uncharacterized protein DUF6378